MTSDPNTFLHLLGDVTAPILMKPNTLITILVARSTPRVRLVGMFFDLDKTFLLPSAIPGIRGLKRQYNQHPDSNLLIVGHTDTSGRDEHNLRLSLERADALAAYLTDKVDPWEAFFHDDPGRTSITWGITEIQLMLSKLPDDKSPFLQGGPSGVKDDATTAAVKDFQRKTGLNDDGVAGPNTRKALIKDYMSLDETSLPSGIKLTTHGCGENFPVDKTGDDVRDPDNRRVEIFFFDGPITPAPPGKTSKRGSTEYPKWRAAVTETIDFSGKGSSDVATFRILRRPDRQPAANVTLVITLADGTRIQRVTSDQGEVELPAELGESFELVDLIEDNEAAAVASSATLPGTADAQPA